MWNASKEAERTMQLARSVFFYFRWCRSCRSVYVCCIAFLLTVHVSTNARFMCLGWLDITRHNSIGNLSTSKQYHSHEYTIYATVLFTIYARVIRAHMHPMCSLVCSRIWISSCMKSGYFCLSHLRRTYISNSYLNRKVVSLQCANFFREQVISNM